MGLITWQSKGSKLTIEEMDGNLTYLDNKKGSSLWEQSSPLQLNSKEGFVKIFDSGGDENDWDSGYSLFVGDGAGGGADFRDFFDNTSSPNARGINVMLGNNAGMGSNRLYFSVLVGAGAGRDTKADLTPYAGGELGIITAVGASAARGIEEVNNSVFFGGNSASYTKNVFRSVIIGQNAASQTSGNSKNIEVYKSTLIGSYNAHGTNNLEHIISIGHEALLGNHERKDSILIGDYVGMGMEINDSIFIGHYRKKGDSPNFGNPTPTNKNVISIGHFVKPEQELTINFPLTYDMGVGTHTPDAKITIKSNDNQEKIATFKDQNDETILEIRNNGGILIKIPEEYADDSTAASGGIPIGGIYRTGSNLKIRIT